MVEAWRHVWRDGFSPLLSRAALEALADGLRRDDTRLLQGATTQPPPLLCVLDWPCEGACPLGYAAMGVGMKTVGEVEHYFAGLCWGAEKLLGDPLATRLFLNHVDETPRGELFAELLGEVEAALAARPAEAA